MSKTGEMPAFPTPDTLHPSGQIEYGMPGLTKREYIAIEAMKGILAGDHPITHAANCMELISEAAISQADAMLNALEKGTGQ